MDNDDTVSCPYCKGTGKSEWQDEVEDCGFCDGEGEVSQAEIEQHDEEMLGEAMMEDERGN